MSQEVQNLTSATDALAQQVNAAVANSTALKSALDAALAALAQAQTQLAQALLNAKDPADVAAIQADLAGQRAEQR